MFHTNYRVKPATLPPGTYRNITGNEAAALGFVAATKLAKRDLFYGSYPITPAWTSCISSRPTSTSACAPSRPRMRSRPSARPSARPSVARMGMTASSGPGIALKGEAMGLAVMVELPLVVVNVQRAGPSTGMPTKTEQSDLLQAMYGRNGDAPLPIVAPATPSECFDYAIEAWRLALKYMTPVVYLSDAFLATGSEPWRIPEPADLPDIEVPNSHRRRRLPALRPRPGHAGTTVGHPRHARPGAPHRWPRRSGCQRRRVLRPGQPPAHDRPAGAQGRRHRRRHPRPGGRRARAG